MKLIPDQVEVIADYTFNKDEMGAIINRQIRGKIIIDFIPHGDMSQFLDKDGVLTSEFKLHVANSILMKEFNI